MESTKVKNIFLSKTAKIIKKKFMLIRQKEIKKYSKKQILII